MTLKLFNRTIGAMLLVLGVWVLLDPRVFTTLYSVSLPEPESRIAIRAIVGGGEIGIGLFLCFGTRIGASEILRARFAAVLFTCLICARLIAFLAEETVALWLWRELSIEAVIAVVLIRFISRNRIDENAQ